MIKYGFYNHNDYSANDYIAAAYDGLISDGIFENIEEGCAVAPFNGLKFSIAPGKIIFKHSWLINDTLYIMEIEEPEAFLTRYDLLVYEKDETNRVCNFKIIKGEPSENPQKPAYAETQLPMVYFTVTPTTTEWTSDNMESLIGTDVCPYVTGRYNEEYMQGNGIPDTHTAQSIARFNETLDDLEADTKAEYDEWKGKMTEEEVLPYRNQLDEIKADIMQIDGGNAAETVQFRNNTNYSKYLSVGPRSIPWGYVPIGQISNVTPALYTESTPRRPGYFSGFLRYLNIIDPRHQSINCSLDIQPHIDSFNHYPTGRDIVNMKNVGNSDAITISFFNDLLPAELDGTELSQSDYKLNVYVTDTVYTVNTSGGKETLAVKPGIYSGTNPMQYPVQKATITKDQKTENLWHLRIPIYLYNMSVIHISGVNSSTDLKEITSSISIPVQFTVYFYCSSYSQNQHLKEYMSRYRAVQSSMFGYEGNVVDSGVIFNNQNSLYPGQLVGLGDSSGQYDPYDLPNFKMYDNNTLWNDKILKINNHTKRSTGIANSIFPLSSFTTPHHIYLNGEVYFQHGILNGVITTGGIYPVIIHFEDGCSYEFIFSTRLKSTKAYRAMYVARWHAPWGPGGTGITTTALAVSGIEGIANNGTVGHTAAFIYEPYTEEGSSLVKYHMAIGIGSCTTDCQVRWSVRKVMGSVDDF